MNLKGDKRMIEFSVSGPHDVPVYLHGCVDKKQVDESRIKDLWNALPESEQPGVYIYAIRAAKGLVPIYIGKSTRAINKEALNPRNISTLNKRLLNLNKGTLVLFCVSWPTGKKSRLSESIDELETVLIQYGIKANNNLLNNRKIKSQDAWGIYGVNGCGHSTKSSRELKKCLNIK